MKKNLKITQKKKLNLGINRLWLISNTSYFNAISQQETLKTFQIIQQFFIFSGRSINFLFRYFFLREIFCRWKKKKFLKRKKISLKFSFFFKKLLKEKFFFWSYQNVKKKIKKKQKKIYVAKLLNFFSSVQNISCSFQLTKNFLFCTLFLNLCFLSFSRLTAKKNYCQLFLQKKLNYLKQKHKLQFMKKKIKKALKQKMKKRFFFFYKKVLSNSKGKANKKKNLGIKLKLLALTNLFNFFTLKKELSKKNLQFFFLFKLRYLIEKKISFILKFPFCLQLITSYQFDNYAHFLLEQLQRRVFRKKKLKKFANHFAIKTLHKIQLDLISSICWGLLYGNAQILAEQFAIGINRTRKQIQFFYWFNNILKFYRIFGYTICGIKVILFGKLGGRLRTRIRKIKIGQYGIKTQTFALKVHYGYSSAETYTGTFGIHIWIYQRDILPLLSGIRDQDLSYLSDLSSLEGEEEKEEALIA
jgi:hypothetical protein